MVFWSKKDNAECDEESRNEGEFLFVGKSILWGLG